MEKKETIEKKQEQWETLTTREKVDRWNNHCERTGNEEGKIHPLDEENLEQMYPERMELMRSVLGGKCDYRDNYIIDKGNAYTLTDTEAEERIGTVEMFEEEAEKNI